MNKKILTLLSGAALSAMLLTGCGNNDNNNETPEVNDVKDNVENGVEDVRDNVENGVEDVKEGVERGVNDLENNVEPNTVDENGKEVVPNDNMKETTDKTTK